MNITINIPQFFNIDGKSGKNFNYLYPLSNGDNTDSRLFILCDGASGGNKGDAATLVTKGFHEYFTEKRPPKNNTVGQLYMNDALRYVERKVSDYVQKNPKKRGMRSTTALLYFNENDTITIAWVGNTRIYHVRGNQILTKTQDHTVNAYQNGNKVVVPRTISGIEPAYLSLSIIKDIQPGDYFMMCNEGVVETLDDRNIRYLLSQGDGNEAKNQAIAAKIKDLCKAHSYKGCSLFLLQINSTAMGSMADMPAAATAGGSDTIDTGPIRKKSSGFKSPTISKTSRNAILMSLLILMVMGLAFAYKFQQSKPEVVFEQQMTEAERLVEKGEYRDAIALYRSSLGLMLEDTSVFGEVRIKIQQAEELQMLGVADKLYKDGKLLKARDEYQKVLTVHPKSSYASKKLQSIKEYLFKEKTRLVAEADSLVQVNGFEEARNSLFEALYLAQQDTQLLYLINNTYKELKEDTLDMALAIGKAIEIGTAPPPSPEEEAAEDELYTDVEEVEVPENKVKPKRRPEKITKAVPLPEDKDDEIITHREYKELLASAKASLEEGDLETAALQYKAALEYNKTDAVVNKLDEINQKIKNKSRYNDLMKQADVAFQAKKYEEAQRLYQTALEVEKDDGFAAQRIEIAKNMIEQQKADKSFQKLLANADKAFNSNNFATARELYQRALSESKDQTALKAKIAQCNQKISAMQADISKKRLRKGEKLCVNTNYKSECYYHLRENNLLYSVNPQILYQLGRHFEGKDTNRARECYNIAAGKGSAQATDRLKQMQ